MLHVSQPLTLVDSSILEDNLSSLFELTAMSNVAFVEFT
jgi:hypothetical protein